MIRKFSSILPGYLLTDDSLLYVRAGLTNSNFKISTTDISLANINRMLRGFRLGLQQKLTPSLALRAEYSNVSYRSTNIATFDVVGNVSKSTQFTPSTNEVEFSR